MPVDLIKVLAQTMGRKVIALLAGNGEQMEPTKPCAAQTGINTCFAGFVNADKLPVLYAAADMLVHPSQADPHPLICSESACIGLPMLLSDRVGAAGPTDIARPGENALIFPCADTSALAGLIDELAGDDARRSAMGARALEILDELDIKASVAGVHRGIDTVLARPR
ncbi:glycosyltransferase [Sphingomonas mali]|uniref:glycosyltransferase n=1 Tax=Sphingomonas mali TaxID=40682 RepID=UPI000832D70C|nr:glycosyltransferase [Sphingomonas mali]